ncbi:hypothetical protein TPHA_0C01190 [Tetrapisispora phaffii CBS 4417]|uniref:Arf-GAP domain-containing protein n=1 Tax=Tetrapisispora phaffii (strain ATCC 24235 / CBS 4417 / NBRC 1672 / NRRL Y-8282 / UCD 70-5) TaxID=1071381 RepID=G8BR99_TETPH|nr:hypothetical protein TPHA_0C01190 [Tetrapisispora phaffii CBS 4417]CCE62275.1 hypothetical protein TPHA_0C01190 [Tetrapisispora phaffii CBS 4417]
MSTSPQIKKALAALLRDPGNSTCADCKTQTHPRWASWSLGVFICIKCAGFHRSLGTHISKVKSVDLDTWKEENIIMLIKFKNNDMANKYYESKLLNENNEPVKININDTNKLQTFIKNKYEYKKWMGDSGKLEELTSNSLQNNDLLNSSQKSQLQSQSPKEEPVVKKNSMNLSNSRSSSILDLQNLSKSPSNNNNNRLNSSTPQLSRGNSNGLLNTVGNSATSLNIQNPNVNRTQPQGGAQRQDLKKSILSLYAKPTNSASNLSNNNLSSSSISLASASSFNNNGNNNNSNVVNINNNINKINNFNNNSKSSSTYNIEDDELMKNVWS